MSSEQNYADAITLIQIEIQKGADEQSLAKEYLQAANGGLELAASQMTQGHYSRAAILLRTIKDNYPRTPELQKQVSSSPEKITADIELCTQTLMDAGLVAYRAGELTKALDIWQQILTINPQHQAAKNASQTTQQQLQKLKTLNGKN